MAIIKHPEQRVGVFIDTQNLYHSAKNIYHTRVNFGNVLKDSVAGRRLIRARAYMVTTESGEEKAFLDALVKMGIEPKTKDLQIFYGGAKKADWDVGMAVVSFGRSTSGKLKEATDNFLDLDEDPKRYLINYRPVRGGRGRANSRDISVSAPRDSIAPEQEEPPDISRIPGVE